MNRHERRTAKAQARASGQADKGFEDYQAQARRTFPKISDREVGEAWMRNQMLTASGAESWVIHEPDKPRARQDGDWRVSVTYGMLKFKAYAAQAEIDLLVKQWQSELVPMLQAAGCDDLRRAAREYLLETLVHQKIVDGNTAAMMVAAIAWLATSSDAVGEYVTKAGVRMIHYEVTDIVGSDGRRGQNFRLVLDQNPDAALPNWVKTAPSTAA